MADEVVDVGRDRDFLKVQVRLLRLDPRLRRRLDSSDLVQEALLRAHQRQGQFRGDSQGERLRWLLRILQNVARDRLDEEGARKRDFRRENSLEELLVRSSARLDELLADRQEPPAERLAREELVARLFQAVGTLDEDQQDAVILRYLLQLPVAEIAARMGRTERAVSGLLFRGLTALRKFRSYLTGDMEGEAP